VTSLLDSVSDALEDIEFVFSFFVQKEDLGGGGEDLGVVDNKFTSLLKTVSDALEDVEFIFHFFIVVMGKGINDLSSLNNELRVFNSVLSGLLGIVLDGAQKVEFFIRE